MKDLLNMTAAKLEASEPLVDGMSTEEIRKVAAIVLLHTSDRGPDFDPAALREAVKG